MNSFYLHIIKEDKFSFRLAEKHDIISIEDLNMTVISILRELDERRAGAPSDGLGSSRS